MDGSASWRPTRRPTDTDGHDTILTALACGVRWQRLIDEGMFANIKELATAIGKSPSQIADASIA